MNLFCQRYTALGLLTFLQLVTTTCCCVTNYKDDDIPARTLTASIVFEGQIHRELHSEQKFKFKVLRVAKGDLPRNCNNHNNYSPVFIGDFVPNSSVEHCYEYRAQIKRNKKYIFFLKTTDAPRRSKLLSDRHKSAVSDLVTPSPKSHFSGADRLRMPVFLTKAQANQVHWLEGAPLLSNDRNFEIAVKNNCTICVRAPKVLKVSPDRSIIEGKKVKIHCRTSGYPIPYVLWYKNGVMVKEEKGGVTILMRNLTSILKIKKARLEDSGSYQCSAVNFVGESSYRRSRLLVSADTTKVVCQEDEWRCSDKRQCIASNYLCNKIDDCIDKSDEQNCAKTTKRTTPKLTTSISS